MGESQSRYSIVERLIAKKLDIMTAKFQLADEIRKAEQTVDSLRSSIEDKKQSYQDDCDREKRTLDWDLENAEKKVANLKERQSDKERMFDAKLKTIEEALKILEDISKGTD